jgi:hypothetical protein
MARPSYGGRRPVGSSDARVWQSALPVAAPGAGGAGPSGTNCTNYWKAPEATVRIVVSRDQMTLSCGSKPQKVCLPLPAHQHLT